MQIDQDLSARTRSTAQLSGAEVNIGGNSSIAGLRVGNEIYLSPRNVVDSLGTFCHEVGHFIGDLWSFKKGDGESAEETVLSIDEIKDQRVFITLSEEEYHYLDDNIFLTKLAVHSPELISIANKLLVEFTKGRFDPDSITFHAVSQDVLDERVRSLDISTVKTDASGNIVAVNSRKGRDAEIPSYTTEYCCMQILENTLYHYGIFSFENYLKFFATSSPAHQRARNIISRAFRGRGWRMPSMVDIKNR